MHEKRIIGSGYHRQYGQAHAEVNCLASVSEADRSLIAASTLFVTLEPCAHFGKTPPCADLIIKNKIPRVIVGCRDPFPEVDGKGIEKLLAAGVEVVTGVLEDECKELNSRFFTFHKHHRPYIVLKWAQTADQKIAAGDKRLFITNDYANRIVHRWRSEEAAILVGTNTALQDDPLLTNRLWDGPSPVRLVTDRQLRLPSTLRIFNDQRPVIVFNNVKEEKAGHVHFHKLPGNDAFLKEMLDAMYQLKILSVLVEGGARLLQSFIDAGYWDEARVITNMHLHAVEGIPAPVLKDATCISEETFTNQYFQFYKPALAFA